MSRDIDNTQDTLDSRDIIERIEELEAEVAYMAENGIADEGTADTAEELRTLLTLMEECKGKGGDEQWRGDWYPVALIRESYFEEAMDEMVEECYTLPKDMPFWMGIKLDYDALKQDYEGVNFNGVTYLVR